MVLADTNVFIDFWNNPTEELTKRFEQEEIVICGVVRADFFMARFRIMILLK